MAAAARSGSASSCPAARTPVPESASSSIQRGPSPQSPRRGTAGRERCRDGRPGAHTPKTRRAASHRRGRSNVSPCQCSGSKRLRPAGEPGVLGDPLDRQPAQLGPRAGVDAGAACRGQELAAEAHAERWDAAQRASRSKVISALQEREPLGLVDSHAAAHHHDAVMVGERLGERRRQSRMSRLRPASPRGRPASPAAPLRRAGRRGLAPRPLPPDVEVPTSRRNHGVRRGQRFAPHPESRLRSSR